ncbi:MAG: dolichol-phosphate mannosyltransferase, partial [Urechidicola sp.]
MSNTLIIIPTYNEKENVELIIRAVFSKKKKFDILVVDDTSSDGTYQIVQKLMNEFPNHLFLEIRAKKT